MGGQAKIAWVCRRGRPSSQLLLQLHMPENKQKGVELIFEIRFALALSDKLVGFNLKKWVESIRIDH